jgi:16S rRNA (guanine527-N7)-methyltransferase
MLAPDAIAKLLGPYFGAPGGDFAGVERVDWPGVCGQLAVYLELILKWNARMNLTAIRGPEEIVRRHFGESLFVARHVGRCTTLLDFGSGAGFPGVPIQLMRPDLQVTLAESQGKKAAFLREVVRELGLRTEVFAGRVEAMPVERRFDVVAMRAVDKMGVAVRAAAARAAVRVVVVGTARSGLDLGESFEPARVMGLPEAEDGVVLIADRRILERV